MGTVASVVRAHVLIYDGVVNCRYCGVEIADKALICYRCGRPTTEARIKPRTSSGKRRSGAIGIVPSVLALLLLVIAALFMGQVATGQTPRIVSWSVAVLAAVLVVWRVVRWRSRSR